MKIDLSKMDPQEVWSEAFKAGEKHAKAKLPPIAVAFKQWCSETKRTGGVIMGPSIREFFEWYENNFKNN